MKYKPFTLLINGYEYCCAERYLVAHEFRQERKKVHVHVNTSLKLYHVDHNFGKVPVKNDIYARIIRALMTRFDGDTARSICRKIRRTRNSNGVGLVGKVVEFVEGDENKISYSNKNIGKKSKKRTKVSFGRFLRRNVFKNTLSDSDIERIQTVFNAGTFSVLNGQDAADVYEYTGDGDCTFQSSITGNNSCMQGKTYNTPLFLNNPDKYRLIVYKEGGIIIGRTKLYTNNNGTHFLGTRTYSDRNIRDLFEEYFHKNFTEGKLCCTLNHNIGDQMPYIDETVDVCGMDRLNDGTIRLIKGGEYTCNEQNGSDPSCHVCCKCGDSADTEVNDEYYCDDHLYLEFTSINGEYYRNEDCVYSELVGEYLLKENAFYFTTEDGEDWTDNGSDLFVFEDEYYHKDDSVIVGTKKVPEWLAIELHDGTYALEDDAVELYNGDYALEDDTVTLHNSKVALRDDAVIYNDEYYLRDECVKTDDGCYVPNIEPVSI